MTSNGVPVLVSMFIVTCVTSQVFDWLKHDKFDDLDDKMVAVHHDNCRAKAKSDMLFPTDTVSQIPKFNNLKHRIFYKNRTSLVHLHNMALNRAFFFSYILQKMNTSDFFSIQPNIHYLYMSVTADINANPSGINGSGVYFDYDCYYPNWFTELDFNVTIPLFAPRAWRWDDTMDSDNYLREPTRKVAFVDDIGAGNGNNYTSDSFKMNPWYNMWLPDNDPFLDSANKFTYGTGIKYSNMTGKFTHNEYELFNFFGPNSPGQDMKDDTLLPVRFTRPYFDCNRSNKWVVSAVSPVVDYMPRYLNWTHMRRPRFVGVIVMDIDFKEVDFNPCTVGVGNPGPSHLAGIAKCRDTTRCKHRSGLGFRRDSYTCSCRSGYYLPPSFRRNYKGHSIEQATYDEYMSSFTCLPTKYLHVLPIVEQTRRPVSKDTANSSSSQGYSNGKMVRRRKRSAVHLQFKQSSYDKMIRIFRHIKMVTSANCKTLSDNALHLSGDVAYGVDTQFELQGRTALRLAHFLSNFHQNTGPHEQFGWIRGGGRLHQEHLFGEVFANVMADHKILASAVYYDPYMFENTDGSKKKFFGPLAFQKKGVTYAIDSAGLQRLYVDEQWYRRARERWSTNTGSLKTYKMRPMVRRDRKGSSSVKFEYFPIMYRASDYADGNWIGPTFKCDGNIDAWVITYVTPFFKIEHSTKKLQFAGVVTVDVPLTLLDINQCPQPFYVANAFKNTARCQTRSTKCRPIVGYGMTRGSYRCDCRAGFEYPFKDQKRWFEGHMVDREYEKKQQGIYSRFDTLACRVSCGRSLIPHPLSLVVALVVIKLFYN
ncbi:uncharacterized protein LOC110443474 [Mizuhopecten yessoensis]|uniref:G-protein coupled receptor 158-like protein n=1 Tax=Mizuhopecten yessoensis TaxID=6573 RepID=A0A210R0W9_MIZYE|nr:uncharacterized protein LOC110443474 [Mizuhopecten yessoensis]XP_021343385.1 uncharacterized protein LOC110443474 [Mizuhopecten yessoensis]XP_021343390.1 uncharacterized protein LOC110443474 [Mizuhopecten yessoensis]XP_021343399.1 uncharacterized protein LOC110443474 [Mizuhopecten yessoensis]XP_021343407.1 uncharacterized protein LOC110443474 [Mizuhopecten yessoensis]XP_021343416.1 uncharacterized protein LOC110443474 [Mizuhopecten yessoensis]OWF54531.1 G-protein coupled receptor 158-like 